MFLFLTALSKMAIENFIAGAAAAVSVRYSVKIPKKKRGKS